MGVNHGLELVRCLAMKPDETRHQRALIFLGLHSKSFIPLVGWQKVLAWLKPHASRRSEGERKAHEEQCVSACVGLHRKTNKKLRPPQPTPRNGGQVWILYNAPSEHRLPLAFILRDCASTCRGDDQPECSGGRRCTLGLVSQWNHGGLRMTPPVPVPSTSVCLRIFVIVSVGFNTGDICFHWS